VTTCVECGEWGSKVTDTRKTDTGWVKRQRKCLECGHRWQTLEIPETLVILEHEEVEDE
jgi:transcriptional regulator NrdR family protein